MLDGSFLVQYIDGRNVWDSEIYDDYYLLGIKGDKKRIWYWIQGRVQGIKDEIEN